MIKKLKRAYPILGALLERGIVYLEKGCYVGKAADGQLVHLGELSGEHSTESYLETHPTPDTW